MNAIQTSAQATLGTRIGDFVFKSLITFTFLVLGALSLTAQECTLSWNHSSNVGLSSAATYDCKTTIRPEDILTNLDNLESCVGDFTVTIFSLSDPGMTMPIDVDPNIAGPQIDETYIGKTLKVIVRHDASGQPAIAEITIEDYAAPELTCTDHLISCLDNPLPVSEGGDVPDIVIEDCSATTATYVDTPTSFDCSNVNYVRSIERVWTVIDAFNNPATCTQIINIARIGLGSGDITEPALVEVSCDAPATSLHPSLTGYPTLTVATKTYDLIPNGVGFCDLQVGFLDYHNTVNFCPGESQIIRTWTIRDLCAEEVVDVNPRTFIQKIDIVDNEGPTITGISDMTFGTSNQKCSAVVSFQPATIVDNCSDATLTILTPFGDLDGAGVLHDVPVGEHMVTYRATDECGNFNDKVIKLTIADDDEPNVVCDQFTVVPLGNNGTAQLLAASLDDGSTDNCGIVAYQVARMASACGPETSFDDFVDFSCCDLDNGPVMVALKVTDAAGNFNICMIEVTVQDKVAPVITCPANKTLTCDDDYTNTLLTGVPVATDNCELADVSYTDEVNLNTCGLGSVIRKWIATDASGNTAECYQTITLSNVDPFEEEDITWPSTYNTMGCAADIDPDNLPAPFGRPVLDVNNCDNVDSYHTDQAIGDQNGAACYVIQRTWTVVDLCIYDANEPMSPGIWTYIQTINIVDNEDPIFTKGHEDQEILVDGDCRNIPYTIMATADDCSPNLTYFYQVDLGNDGSIDTANTAQMADLHFTEGIHKISWRVTDGCGNEAITSQLITFRDTKAPTANLKAIFVTLMPVNGGMIEVNAKQLNNSSSDNCTPILWLRYSYSADPADSLRMFTCADLGQNTVDIYVHDSEGNFASATTFIDIQDGHGICPIENASITGLVTTPNGDAIANVQLELEGASMNAVMTDIGGSYNFNSIPSDASKLKPTKNVEAMNGVSTYDMVLMQRHILGISEFTDPYTSIAADVNNSGSISTADMVAMRKLILDINDNFGNTDSWRFVLADHDFNAGSGSFPEDYPLNNPSTDMQVDFIGIKMGDINANASTQDLLGGEDQIGAPLQFEVLDLELEAGQSYNIPFVAKNFEDVIGFQYTLQFDAEAIALTDIASGELEFGDQNHNLTLVDNGVVATNWYDALPTSIDDNEILFSINITVKKDLKLSEVLSIGSDKTEAESYRQESIHTDLITGSTEIQFIQPEIEIEGFELGQNAPNPFNGSTTITVSVPRTVDGQLTIYDLTGKAVKVWSQNFDKGIHQIQLHSSDLPDGGVYYYQFQADGFTDTKKMIMIQ